MAITPLDIQNAEFRVGFRGYNQSEVDSFLNKIVVDYEKLYKENQVIKDELKRLENDIGKYKNIEDNLSATLVLAQETANTLRVTAEKEATFLVQEADIKAKQIIEEAQKEIEEKDRELQILINQFNSYKFKMLSFIETQYRIIKEDTFLSISQDEDIAHISKNIATEKHEQAHKQASASDEESKDKPDEQKVD